MGAEIGQICMTIAKVVLCEVILIAFVLPGDCSV